MVSRTRRALLALLAGAGPPLAGCQTDSGGPSAPPTASPRTDPPTRSSGSRTPSTTDTETAGRLVLSRTTLAPGTTATVYPERLQSLLREAATTRGTLRVRAETPVYAPEPVLPALRTVRLESPDSSVDGRYRLAAEGGTYYEWRVGTTPVDSVPEGADVTSVEDLPPRRRAFADRALERGGTLVSPETELGSWVRHAFVGGYVSRDGRTYRGRKLARTDAAFFSREVWYVLSLTPAPERGPPTGTTRTATPPTTAPPVALRLRPVPDAVRAVVDGLVGTNHRDRVSATLAEADVDGAAVGRFARETEGLLFDAASYEVSMVEADAR